MIDSLIFLLLPLMLSSPLTLHEGDASQARMFESTTLCEALETIGVGEKRDILVQGVLTGGQSIFYDPNEVECRLNVQPFVWFRSESEISENVAEYHELLARDRRIRVTVRGTLLGPSSPRMAEDDLSMPWIAAYAERAPGRYGHMGHYRALLVGEEILDFGSVGELEPHRGGWDSPYPRNKPKVLAAQWPDYPKYARNIGLEGDVVLGLYVEDGEVRSVDVLSGDRLLFQGAKEAVASWKLQTDGKVWLTTRFSYRLELWEARKGPNPRVEAHLPSWVKITAPRKER